MEDHDQLLVLAWSRTSFPGPELVLGSDYKTSQEVGLDEVVHSELESAAKRLQPVTSLERLEDFYDAMKVAAELARGGRLDEASTYLEASRVAVAQYEAKRPDWRLATALFYRALALVSAQMVGDAYRAIRYSASEFRLCVQEGTIGEHALGPALADCLHGYVKAKEVGDGTYLGYFVRGIRSLQIGVAEDGKTEGALLWALELFVESLEWHGAYENAYLLRLEIDRRREKDALRLQAAFDLGQIASFRKRAGLARRMGMVALGRREEEAANLLAARVREADLVYKDIDAFEIGNFLSSRFVEVERALSAIAAERG